MSYRRQMHPGRSRRSTLVLGARAWLALATIALLALPAAAERPNIVIILSDDLGYGDVGFHGCTDIPTPHIDSLAQAGVRFAAAYANGSFCTPTRAALISGLYQQRFGNEDLSSVTGPLPLAIRTLPERLQAAGYTTLMVGKWHLGDTDGYWPIDRGFDHMFGFLGGGHHYLPGPNQRGEYAASILRDREPLVEQRYLTDAFGIEAARFVEAQQAAERPFFLYLAFNAVHTPLEVTEEYLTRFPDTADPRRQKYAGMLSAMDDAIGRVLDSLRRTGQLDRTLVIFTNDNGGPTTRNAVNGSSNRPLRGSKCETFEGGIRVPLALQWPGVLPAGAVYAEPVISFDLTATALAAAEADATGIDGVNLIPYLTDRESGSPHEALFWRCRTRSNNYAALQGGWKFVHSTEGTEQPGPGQTPARDMLFHLTSDLAEQHDLASERPEKLAELKRLYEAWSDEVDADCRALGIEPPGLAMAQPAAREPRRRARRALSAAGTDPSDRPRAQPAARRAAVGRATATADASSTARPNIVLIYADDWGWGDLSCHGSSWLSTPHLDALARQGVDFEQFNVLNPVCSPSRTALITGHYPARYGVHQHFAHPDQNHERGMPDWLDPRAVTLPRLLQQAGYGTAHFGKWHLTNRQTLGAPRPEEYGYDEWAVFNGGAGWPAAGIADTAANTVKFIQDHRDGPFFINVWLHETHTPHAPSVASLERWTALDEQQRVYAAVVTDGDRAVGEILAALDAAEVADNTLVLFSSDNGPESTGANPSTGGFDPDANVQGYGTYYSVGETGGLRGRKRSLFEGGVRVPLIVRWPGHAPAGVVDQTTVISAVDLLPTLCAAAGVELPEGYSPDGENLLPALEGEPLARRRPLFWQWQGRDSEPDWWPRLAVRDGDFKLLLTSDGARAELYRVPRDRAERRDIAAEHPDVVARLTKLALDWQATLPPEPDASCIGRAAPATAVQPSGSQSSPGAARPMPDRARAMARWDLDGDGQLTFEEYRTGLAGQANLEQRFARFDRDGDGRLTREEFVGPAAARP